MRYKLGHVSISFREHTPQQIVTAMKEAGLACIEWGSDVHAPADDEAALEKIAALQVQYGISCCSYGTYFHLGETPLEELPKYIRAAKLLGTDILRLWCGTKNSEEYTPEEETELYMLCRKAAAMAEEAGVALCMECHMNTYTNRKEAALGLMLWVNSLAFRMYWQPQQYHSAEENLAYARLLAPYTEHLHVFNWCKKEKYPLGEAKELWKQYLACFPGDKTLLLEFMPDGRIESLCAEAQALKEIAGGL